MKLTAKFSTTLLAAALAYPLTALAAGDMHGQGPQGAGPSTRGMPQAGQPGQMDRGQMRQPGEMRQSGQMGQPGQMARPGQAGQPAETEFASEQTGKDGVRYVTGGVGEGEQTTLKQRYSDFSMMLVNATKQRGAYVADVDVSVRDAKGNEIIGTTTDGPWLIADLPPGRYTVEATYNGNKQTRTINVGEQGQQRVVMTWAEGAS